MKKQEMIQELSDNGYKNADTLNWDDLRKEHTKFMNKPTEYLAPVSQEFIEERLEVRLQKNIEEYKTLKELREHLLPEIREFIKGMKGVIQPSKEEIANMFTMYNAYYSRNDTSGCNACVSRVFNTLKKL